ncbi:hypothetical protein [Acidovorax sp.]|uniref:hypothetical protein n=1 Tax=Acidovorax sp. TaxID=1872122 RepID=UPI00391F2514
MESFESGPFEYVPIEERQVNGAPHIAWEVRYGRQLVERCDLPVGTDRHEVQRAFADPRAQFTAKNCLAHSPKTLVLQRWDSGDPLASFTVETVPEAMRDRKADVHSEFWLRLRNTRLRMPVTLAEYAEIVRTHGAPDWHWITGLLRPQVTTRNVGEWIAPTSWEIRHIVGEGSFTGVSGAQAAALVGVTPQNFRKYTARDGASTRQNISFAMWHLLLSRMHVQRA